MTTKTETEKKVTEELKKPEKAFDPSVYSCEIILEKTTSEKSQDRQLPTDAFIVKYKYEGNLCIDVTRSEKMANIFDMYYDRYGKDSLQKIDYGHGTIRPNLWGVRATPPKRKKRKG
mgnify:CR=1 FL=1|tara:strand:+ start:749 stop:1099 length:351 start_codon:yes stop_codon:yes gene_type:complete